MASKILKAVLSSVWNRFLNNNLLYPFYWIVPGLAFPLVVPKIWGTYPDFVYENERREREAKAMRKASREAGMFAFNRILLCARHFLVTVESLSLVSCLT